jgi:hypothetical protein
LNTVWSITVNDYLYEVVDDRSSVYTVIITGAVTDEILGNLYEPAFSVEVARNDLQSKTTAQGLYAISGYVNASFPKLGAITYTINFTLRAPGFRDYPLQVTLPVVDPVFPMPAPAAAMRRLPVRLQGRVVLDASGAPVSGATVITVDNPNPPSPPPPPPIPHTMLLRSPLYFHHAVNTTVQQVSLAIAGTAKLTQPAAGGSTSLLLDNTTGLSGAAFVQLATPSLTLVEYATVKGFGSQPGEVLLNNPLNRSYAPGTASTVQFVTATTTGPVSKLLLDADSGDGLLVADQLLEVATLVVDDGSPVVEYHEGGALSDSNGYYAVNGIGRVQQIFLRANPLTPGTPVIPWAIEFDQAVNVVDFRI